MHVHARWSVLGLCLLASLHGVGLAQQDSDAPPARVVLVFESDPKQFSSITLDEAPFAKLTFPQEQATVWSAPAGSHTLTIRAEGAQPKDLKADFKSGQTYLVVLALEDIPGSKQPGAPTKRIKLAPTRLDLPAPDAEVRGFVYLSPDAKPFSGELVSGSSRDAKSAPLTVAPGKLTPLPAGRFSLLVEGKPLVFLNSSEPGLFVYLLFPSAKGELKPRSFVVFSDR